MYHVHSRVGVLLASAAVGVMAVAGCSTGSSEQDQSTSTSSAEATPTTGARGASPSASEMGNLHGGPVPDGMKKAADPQYPVGSSVTLTADHMPGMRLARALVVGAYDTFTYAVTYTPTTGDPPVKNHKWVVQEEIKGAGTKRLAGGAKVVLTADHMPGMKGARATVVSSTSQPVYAVNYTAHEKTMTNHKWVVEDEMQPAL